MRCGCGRGLLARTRLLAAAREVGVFGEEAVARVNCLDAVLLRNSNNSLEVQVSADRSRLLAHAVALVSLEAVLSHAVSRRIHGDLCEDRRSLQTGTIRQLERSHKTTRDLLAWSQERKERQYFW